MSTVVQGYRFALDPDPGQVAALRSHCGGQRYAYNWGLALVKANLDQRKAEASYGVPDDELTPALPWSAYRLRKSWNQAKGEVAPWWSENSKEAYSSGLANLAAALGNWSDSRTGKRKGPQVRFPRFKGKWAGLSCRFTTGAFGLAEDRRHVKLPRIGTVRTYESTRKLARHVERGTKTCSACGAVKAKLRLSERVFRCDQCPLVLDRDLNAARNLAALVSSHSWWATVNEPDGNPRQTRTARATGTATGRPGPHGPGQRRCGNAPAA